MTPSTHERFPPTSWTLIELAQRAEGDEYRSLMEVVVERYIRPVQHFIRTRGYSQSDAPDLTNEFFMKLDCEREWLLGRAMQELKDSSQRSGQAIWYAVFLKCFLLDHVAVSQAGTRLSYRRLGGELAAFQH